MLKSLIRLALKINFRATLRTAAKLEYGAGIFCHKLAIRARNDGYLNLAEFLIAQYTEEDSHARMLGGLVDGGDRLHRNTQTGVWEKGDYQALDGISQRYWAAKLFFWFKKPEQLDWADTLAFMCVVESQVAKFYEVLQKDKDSAVVAIAQKILIDETQHADYLKNCLSCFHSDPEGAIAYWQDRKVLAAIGGLIDLVISH
ncbi:ferritin-like domain-containing protein [Nostoc sp.]|uniref:ferritin-like domain-containing protein n=1 Tax=Nostoc sp. TaxID=1180 RepID=UPI002FF3ED62